MQEGRFTAGRVLLEQITSPFCEWEYHAFIWCKVAASHCDHASQRAQKRWRECQEPGILGLSDSQNELLLLLCPLLMLQHVIMLMRPC